MNDYRKGSLQERVNQVLNGCDSPETAWPVDDYPYGYNQRTTIRYWIETKKGYGQRMCSQTVNPRTGKWNKPKKSTYTLVLGMYLDKANNYVRTFGVEAGGWSKEEYIQDFEQTFELTEYMKGAIKYARATNVMSDVIAYEIKASRQMKKSKRY